MSCTAENLASDRENLVQVCQAVIQTDAFGAYLQAGAGAGTETPSWIQPL